MADSRFINAKQIAEGAKRRAENAAAGRSPDVIQAASRAGEAAFRFSAGGGQAFAPAGGVPGAGGGAAQAGGVPLPGAVFGAGIREFFSGIGGLLRNPRGALIVGVLSLLWLVLGALGGAGLPFPFRFLSWLSFAEGGLYRSLPGMLFGILGKGTVAAALVSLTAPGGPGKVLKGAGKLFPAFGQRGAGGKAAAGALSAVVIYFLIAGPFRISAGTAMAGISGLILSLRALGGSGDFLYRFTEALTAKRGTNGLRLPDTAGQQGLLAGLSAGFAGISVLSFLF